jgi:exodeoxyribonuclease-1
MTFIFYDTETTGLDWAFDQILQFAAIVTDDDFKVVEEVNLRCRLQCHVLPSPGAMAITGVGPMAIQAAPHSFYEMACLIRRFIERWTPAVITGFNSVSFDEMMLRGAFYQTLHPPYLTNIGGNTRMDVLRLAHAVAEYRPEAINVPLNEKDWPIFKLGHLIEANGLTLDNAHDAMADTRATVALARMLKERAPDVWDGLYACRSRHTVEAILEKNDLVFCTDRAFGKPTILGGLITWHPDNPASLAMFDLAYDPALYLDINHERAVRLLKSSPRPIRVVRANALPIIFPFTPGRDAGVDPNTAKERLVRIRAHLTFATTIGKAMAAQYEDAGPAAYVEQRLYEGFPSTADSRRMEQFHKTPWIGRCELVQGFEDGRFRELAERLVYNEHPEVLPPDRRAAFDSWRRERFAETGKVPWLTLSAARVELDELRSTGQLADTDLLADMAKYFAGLEAEIPPV